MRQALEDLPLQPEAAELLRDYRSRLEQALQGCRLPEAERREIRREIESHLWERLRRLAISPIERQHVLDVLYKLGEPESYVPLYLTHSDLARGLRGSPRHLLRGWGRWLRATAAQYVFSLPFVFCYLLSLLLMVTGLLKLAFPESFRVYATLPAAEAEAQDKERVYLSFAFSFDVPPSSPTPSAEGLSRFEAGKEAGKGKVGGTSGRVELHSPWGAAALLGAGLGIALLATGLLRRLLRRMLLRQYGI